MTPPTLKRRPGSAAPTIPIHKRSANGSNANNNASEQPQLDPASAAVIAKLIAGNDVLTELALTPHGSVGHEEALAVVSSLKTNTALQQLRLSKARLPVQDLKGSDLAPMPPPQSPRAAKAAKHRATKAKHGPDAEGIRRVPQTSNDTVNLAETGVGFSDIVGLAELLKTNHTLRLLSAAQCEVEDFGLLVLLRSLRENHSVTRLDVSHNAITPRGVRQFWRILYKHQHFRTGPLKEVSLGSATLEIKRLLPPPSDTEDACSTCLRLVRVAEAEAMARRAAAAAKAARDAAKKAAARAARRGWRSPGKGAASKPPSKGDGDGAGEGKEGEEEDEDEGEDGAAPVDARSMSISQIVAAAAKTDADPVAPSWHDVVYRAPSARSRPQSAASYRSAGPRPAPSDAEAAYKQGKQALRRNGSRSVSVRDAAAAEAAEAAKNRTRRPAAETSAAAALAARQAALAAAAPVQEDVDDRPRGLVDLSAQQVHELDAVAVVEAVLGNTTLTALKLRGCSMGVSAISELARGLPDMKSIKYVHLGRNSIESVGTRAWWQCKALLCVCVCV